MPRGLKDLYAEAKRRRVIRTVGVYLVAVFGASQGAAELAPLFGAPDWAVRAFVIGAIAFSPVVIVLSWMFDIGREGIVRDPETASASRFDDEAIAGMSTIAGGEMAAGAVVVRWDDVEGEHARLFDGEFLLGRGGECQVRFYDPLVSRRHARFFFEDGAWRLEDLGSRNGTLVNDQPAGGSVLVGESLIQVNEAGPVLRIQVLDPGEPDYSVVTAGSVPRGVAHVRSVQ